MLNNNNGYPSSTRAWVTVAILMVAYVLSFIDRQILNLLVGPIRRDLMISDTQMPSFSRSSISPSSTFMRPMPNISPTLSPGTPNMPRRRRS